MWSRDTLSYYARMCNYNPLAMISIYTGQMATAAMDAIIDRDSLDSTILTAPIIVPIGAGLIGLELFIDSIFRPSVAKDKIANLMQLAKSHNKLGYARSYDLFYSLKAEAAHCCPYGADFMILRAMNTALEDDFMDYSHDRAKNIFRLKSKIAIRLFRQWGVEETYNRVKDGCPKHGKPCPIYQSYPPYNPVDYYQSLRRALIFGVELVPVNVT